MNFIENVRNQLNCSQREFARYLEYSRRKINNVDAGQDYLNAKADIRLMFLYDSIRQLDKEGGPQVVETGEMEQLRSRLDERNLEIRVELNRLNDELAVMINQHDRASKAWRYYELAVANSGSMDLSSRNWIAAQAKVQFNLIKRNDLGARHAVRVRMAQLEAELRMNSEAVG